MKIEIIKGGESWFMGEEEMFLKWQEVKKVPRLGDTFLFFAENYKVVLEENAPGNLLRLTIQPSYEKP